MTYFDLADRQTDLIWNFKYKGDVPCLISALRIPMLATPLTAPVFEGLATAMPRDGTTAPPVEGCVWCGVWDV